MATANPFEPVNVFDVEPEYRADAPAAYARGAVQIGPLIGASLLGASVYELPAGVSTCPYHYEHGREEWLLVLAGRPTLRSSDGEAVLKAGDVACLPEGPAGAHKVTNESAEVARVMILSTKGSPAVVVYPDSGKVGFWTGDDYLMVRRSSHVDYFDGEA